MTKEEAEARECKGPMKRNAGDRLPASYINFYHGNGGAVIPAFGEATDEPYVPSCQCHSLWAHGPELAAMSMVVP